MQATYIILCNVSLCYQIFKLAISVWFLRYQPQVLSILYNNANYLLIINQKPNIHYCIYALLQLTVLVHIRHTHWCCSLSQVSSAIQCCEGSGSHAVTNQHWSQWDICPICVGSNRWFTDWGRAGGHMLCLATLISGAPSQRTWEMETVCWSHQALTQLVRFSQWLSWL